MELIETPPQPAEAVEEPAIKIDEPLRYRGKVDTFSQETGKGWIKYIGPPTELIQDFVALAVADFKADTPPMKFEEVEFSLKPNNKERVPELHPVLLTPA